MEDTSVLTVHDVVMRVRQRPVLAVAPLMLGLLLSVAYVLLTAPTYAASASVKVEPVVADRYAGNVNVSNLISMQTEMQVAQSTEVAALAATALGFDQRTVRHAITVDSPQDTQVLNITYTASTPSAATRGAQVVAASYLSYRKTTSQAVAQAQYKQVLANIASVEKKIAAKSTGALQGELDVLNAGRRSLEGLLANNAGEIINNPSTPTSPASPKPFVAIPAGVGLGLICGLVLAVLWPSRNRRRTLPAPQSQPARVPRPAAQQQARRARDAAGGVPAARPMRPYVPPNGAAGGPPAGRPGPGVSAGPVPPGPGAAARQG